ncbi:MAG TPA: hypothetical protein VGE74_01825, partial [Gemmata sp.]
MSDNLFDRQRAALANLGAAARARAAAEAELTTTFGTARDKAEREIARARKTHAAALAKELEDLEA